MNGTVAPSARSCGRGEGGLAGDVLDAGLRSQSSREGAGKRGGLSRPGRSPNRCAAPRAAPGKGAGVRIPPWKSKTASAALPKVELHQHVDGSIPPAVTWELMKAKRLNPVDTLDELRRRLELQDEEEGTLLAYLDKMHYPLWITQFYENITRVTEAIVEEAAAAGVRHPGAALLARDPHLRRAHSAPVDPRGALRDEPRAEAPRP